MRRLEQIEGLRAYLALWVLVSHVMAFAGYAHGEAPLGLTLLRRGDLPVDGFIVVSGFVIMLLLDRRREDYRTYITRRFFRLWPVFWMVFLLTIPTIFLYTAFDPERAAYAFRQFQWFGVHVALHLPMLHGLVPDSVLPGSAVAFLPPAWSISLEWQFYLIAPLVYAVLQWKYGPWVIGAVVVLIYAFRGQILPAGMFAALPSHVEHFYLGGLLYFAWKRWPQIGAVGRFTGPLFGNRIARYLGKISYSVYLSHWPVVVIMAWALSFLGLPRPVMFMALLPLTVFATIAVSGVLYRFIEVPGIEFGRRAYSRPVASSVPAGSRG